MLQQKQKHSYPGKEMLCHQLLFFIVFTLQRCGKIDNLQINLSFFQDLTAGVL